MSVLVRVYVSAMPLCCDRYAPCCVSAMPIAVSVMPPMCEFYAPQV